MHPAPHLFGGIRQVRGQQARERIKTQAQRVRADFTAASLGTLPVESAVP